MLLAGLSGGAGLCAGRNRGLSGMSASEARMGLTGIGGAAARRRSKAAESVSIKVRISMGLLLESPPNAKGLAPRRAARI
jgi:hypothetical protein